MLALLSHRSAVICVTLIKWFMHVHEYICVILLLLPYIAARQSCHLIPSFCPDEHWRRGVKGASCCHQTLLFLRQFLCLPQAGGSSKDQREGRKWGTGIAWHWKCAGRSAGICPSFAFSVTVVRAGVSKKQSTAVLPSSLVSTCTCVGADFPNLNEI